MRRIAAIVYEEVRECTYIELEVPDDLDLTDKEAVDEYLEEAFVQGLYKEVPSEGTLSVDERYFSPHKELTP